jgi:imidazole glycerol-phosphate synthase subunit HisF
MRLIPIITVDKHFRAVKTQKFGERIYLGDPINIARLFSGMAVDELILLDIDQDIESRDINYEMVERVASQCFMPVAYGGGIRAISQVEQLNTLGIEKFVIKSSLNHDNLLIDIASQFGRQALVGCIDYNSQKSEDLCSIIEILMERKDLVGEFLLQAMDRDGLKSGLDLELALIASKKINNPLIFAGGLSCKAEYDYIRERCGASVASGAYFSLVGKYNACLVNYPNEWLQYV